MPTNNPLSSLHILDFTSLLPGPFATMLLADLGATVVRIENPHRPDVVRSIPPLIDGVSSWHTTLNRNKRSLLLDLKKPAAAAIIHHLLATFDILIEQFRPGVMERLGLGYEALQAINPRLIYGRLTGYGQTGPWQQRAGHDNNYLAQSGILSHAGTRTSGPPPLGIQIADIGGGSLGALIGILAAVIQRQHTGKGQVVDISMFDMMLAWQSHLASGYLVSDVVPEPEAMLLNGGSFYGTYATQDGRYLSVGSLEPKFWRGFCQAIGRSDLIPLGTASDPVARQQLKTEIQVTLASKSLTEWVAVFAPLDVCVEPVLTLPETLAQPQVAAREMVVAVPQSDGTVQYQIGTPFKLSGFKPEYRHVGTEAGAHTEELLREAGYAPDQIALLRQQGIFG